MTDASQSSVNRTKSHRLRRILIRLLCYYLVLTGMLALLQRKLIYQPRCEDDIPVSAAGLMADFTEHVRVTAHDGIELNGWRVTPRNQRPRCTVLFFSGNGGNRQGRVHPMSLLAQAGCEVWLIDYRGYGENAGSPTEADLTKDAQTIWDHLTQDLKIDHQDIVLYGQSLGGGVAVRLASEVCAEGTPPAGLITVATFSSLVDAAQHRFPYVPVGWLLVDRYPSIDRIGNITCPLLHLHGTHDNIVPMNSGRQLFERAPAASVSGIPKQFVELAESGHNDIFTTATNEYSQAIREFVSQVLTDTDQNEHQQ